MCGIHGKSNHQLLQEELNRPSGKAGSGTRLINSGVIFLGVAFSARMQVCRLIPEANPPVHLFHCKEKPPLPLIEPLSECCRLITALLMRARRATVQSVLDALHTCCGQFPDTCPSLRRTFLRESGTDTLDVLKTSHCVSDIFGAYFCGHSRCACAILLFLHGNLCCHGRKNT